MGDKIKKLEQNREEEKVLRNAKREGHFIIFVVKKL